MSAIIANIERIERTEHDLRNKYDQYLAICKLIETDVTSLRRWHGLEKTFMDYKVKYGLYKLRDKAQVIKNNADYLYRWRINMMYAQDTMLNRIRYLG